ncbi:MAG: hypothetical protein KDA32_14860 [Phycisphaerales bacterium]|nr:hypothetical protein [Phycisphaerales bacterium]
MAETAFQTQYRQDFVDGFEQKETLLRTAVTTEAVIKGNTATFLVADSGSAEAKTRGVNGLIPARGDNLTQPAVTLVEWHDLVRKTGFNIFASQGNQVAIMQRTSMGVINRKIDYDIYTELNTGTVNTGTAVTASIPLVMRAKTILGIAEVPWDSNLFAAITPAFEAYLMQTKEFASREYINRAPLENADPAWRDRPLMYYWLGVTWMVHPRLPGVGTSAEKCFMWHKSAIGHAYNSGDLEARAGYNEEQAYSWARTSIYMGSQLLQNSGVVVMNHDGSALVAA